MPDDGLREVGNGLAGQFEGVVFFGLWKIAPDLPFQKTVPVPPSAPKEALHPFLAQPPLPDHRREKVLDLRSVIRKKSLERSERDSLLFVEARQDLLDQHAGERAGQGSLHLAPPGQPLQGEESQELVARPFAPADAPEMGAALAAVAPTDALQEGRYRIRRLVEEHPVYVADVDAQFERARGDAQRVGPTPKPALDAPAFFGLQVGVVQFGAPLEAPFVVEQGEEPVAAAAAVGEDQDFPVAPRVVEVVQQGDEFAVFVFQMDQVRDDLALHRGQHPDGVGPEAEELDHRIGIGDGGRKGNPLHRKGRPARQAFEQVGQLLSPIAVDQGMHLVDDHGLDPPDEPAQIGIRAAQRDVERFRGGQEQVGAPAAGPLEVAGAHGEAQTQPLEDRPKPPLQVEGQRPRGHYVDHRRRPPGLDHPFDAGRQHGLGLPRPRRRLQDQVPPFEQRRDHLPLYRMQMRKRAEERPVGVGELQQGRIKIINREGHGHGVVDLCVEPTGSRTRPRSTPLHEPGEDA